MWDHFRYTEYLAPSALSSQCTQNARWDALGALSLSTVCRWDALGSSTALWSQVYQKHSAPDLSVPRQVLSTLNETRPVTYVSYT